MSVRNIWAIMWKDLIDAVKNSSIFFTIILPIGLSLLFKIIFPSGDQEGFLKVGVYDPGESRLVAQLEARPEVQLVEIASPDRVQAAIEEEQLVGILLIPADFDALLDQGSVPELPVYLNGRAGIAEQGALQSILEEEIWNLIGQKAPAQIVVKDVIGGDLQADEPFLVDTMFLIMLIVMGISLVGTFVVPMLLVEEKERQTILALRVSPVSVGDVIVGKALVGLIYALLISLILMSMNGGWTGTWTLTLGGILLGSLFVVMVGLCVGSFFQTINEVNTWGSILVLVLSLPSWTTMLSLPERMEKLLELLPTYHLSRLIASSVRGQVSWDQAGVQLGILAASVVIAFLVAVWALRRETVTLR